MNLVPLSTPAFVGLLPPVELPMNRNRFSFGQRTLAEGKGDLEFGYLVADEAGPPNQARNATILFVPPGVVSWEFGPPLPLAARAKEMRRRNNFLLVASVLNERRCWVQYEKAPPMVLSGYDAAVDPRFFACAALVRYLSVPDPRWYPTEGISETDAVAACLAEGVGIDVQVDQASTEIVALRPPAEIDS